MLIESTALFNGRAYEVLSKPETRRRYDHFGTPSSPPPMASSSRRRAEPDPMNTFFGTSPDSQPFSFQWESSHDSARRASAQRGNGYRRPFGGMDPFELFNQMFAADMNHGVGGGSAARGGIFDDHPFFASHRRMDPGGMGGFGAMGGGFDEDVFGMPGSTADDSAPARRGTGGGPSGAGLMGGGGGGGFGGFGSMMGGFGPSMMGGSSSMMSSSSTGGGGGGVSESRQTRTINGRTETVVRRVDAQGNETVHTITPEQQTVHVNGVEQPNHPMLQGAGSGRGGGRAGAIAGGAHWPF